MTTFSLHSNISKASHLSQKILDQVSIKSSSALYQMQAILNDDIIQSSLAAFGSYISRQMRTGRAIQVPKFGVFGFSAPSVTLSGVTNPIERDKQPREPVFLISKQFLPGKTLRPGVYTDLGIRTLGFSGICGSNQYIKANYIEAAYQSNLDKEIVKTSCERVFRAVADHVFQHGFASLEIPEVGILMIKGDLAAVNFQEGLKFEVRTVLSRSMKERKERVDSNLTMKNIRELAGDEMDVKEANPKVLKIEDDAKRWLGNNLGLNVDEIFMNSNKDERGDIGDVDAIIEGIDGNSGGKGSKDILFESVSQRNYTGKKSSLEKKRPLRMMKSTTPLETALKKIKSWLKLKSLKSSDGFFELATAGIGRNTNIGSKFSRETLRTGLEKHGLIITGIELESLFERLDQNKDNLFDLKDWCDGITEDEEILQYIRDTIHKHHILSDDFLKRMGFTREQGPLNDLDVRNGLKRLMPDLSEMTLSKALKYLQSKGPLTPIKLLEIFEFEDATENVDEDYLNIMFRKLAQKDYNSLALEFERFDKGNQGRLDIANFKTCLFKAKLDLDYEDIIRIARYIEKDKDLMIDYVTFIQRIQKSSNLKNLTASSESISQLASHIKSFLQKNSITLKEFLKTLVDLKAKDILIEDPTKPKVLTFAQLFYPHLPFNKVSFESFKSLAYKVDIDNDGCIDYYDLEIFLKRYNYIDPLNGILRPSTELRSRISQSKTAEPGLRSTHSANKTQSLFPKIALNEAKFDEVIGDLKRVIVERKLTFFEVFQALDANEDGFLTINEFVEGMDKFMRLSLTIKEGLFAYFDTLRIGMVDYPQFLGGLKKPPNSKKKAIVDNWDWQENIVKKLQLWFQNEKISYDDAFKIADQDFDGVINKTDLKQFLLNKLKIQPDEATSTSIDRLYKLLDFSKKGFIYKSDFKKVLLEGGNWEVPSDSVWLVNVKQQLGLHLSKSFTDLKHSFERISKHSNRLTYLNFKQYIEDSRSLNGFNLTETLLQQFFAYLDPHKKGFLSENDWENAFKTLDFEKQKLNEIVNALIFHFKTLNDAYNYFKKNNNNSEGISFQEFYAGVHGILPQRFHENELKPLYRALADTEGINIKTFENFIWKQQNLQNMQKSQFSQTLKSFKNSEKSPIMRNSQNSVSFQQNSPHFDKIKENTFNLTQSMDKKPFLLTETPHKTLESLRLKLKTTNKDLESEIAKHDPLKSGLIPLLEFKNLLKDLKLGLENSELMEVLNLFQTNNGFFDWKRFLRILQKSPTETSIYQRTKKRLESLSRRINDYMISAKDAFRQFNEDNSGKMTFEEFSKLVRTLYKKDNEPGPAFDIIKDLFEFIDLRKDGFLDIHEWMQTFRNLQGKIIEKNNEKHSEKLEKQEMIGISEKNSENCAVKTIKSSETSHKQKLYNLAINMNMKFNERTPLQWEDSQEYDSTIELIVRNRKRLQEVLEENGIEGKISREKAIEVMKNLLKIENLPDSVLRKLLKFSQKEEAGHINIRFLMDVLKDRAMAYTSPPKNFKHREYRVAEHLSKSVNKV